MIPQRHGQTGGQADGQTTCRSNTYRALRATRYKIIYKFS